MKNQFFVFSTVYLVAFTFFLGILPRIVVNSLDTSNNPFKYSHVLINN